MVGEIRGFEGARVDIACDSTAQALTVVAAHAFGQQDVRALADDTILWRIRTLAEKAARRGRPPLDRPIGYEVRR